MKLRGLADGVLPIMRVAANSPAFMAFDQSAQQASDRGIVIGDKNTHCHSWGAAHSAFADIFLSRSDKLVTVHYGSRRRLTHNTVHTGLPGQLPTTPHRATPVRMRLRSLY